VRGRFGDTSGRPYIEGRLIIPRLNITTDISFLIDTGSDLTVLNPLDGFRMEVDYSQLIGDREVVGVGGLCHNYVEPTIVVFSEPQKFLYVYNIELEITPPNPEIMDIPSLLGRDILNQWRMTYNPSKNRLTFNVISADIVVPIANQQT
jgi:hypothetical protein